MIVVATTAANDHPIPWYLESYGAPIRDMLTPVHYESLLEERDPIAATYCFADLELMSSDQLRRAANLRRRLLARGCRVVNDPERTLRRVDLNRALTHAGVNDFTVYREHEPLDGCRFPVFVRGEHDHEGRRSGLLDDPFDVHTATGKLRAEAPDRGDLLVVEFCDTADVDGVYRKYSAFKVGDAILARHLFFSRDWEVKQADLEDEALLQEERDFVGTNPHEQQLRMIFELAGVDYGRIDYAFREGRIQVWEINTNPTILTSAQAMVQRGAHRPRIVTATRAAAKKMVGPALRHRVQARELHARVERQPRARRSTTSSPIGSARHGPPSTTRPRDQPRAGALGERPARRGAVRPGRRVRRERAGLELSGTARQHRQPPRQPAGARPRAPRRDGGRDRARLRQGDGTHDGGGGARKRRAATGVDGDLQRLVRPGARAGDRSDRTLGRGVAGTAHRVAPHEHRPGRSGPYVHEVGRPAGLAGRGRGVVAPRRAPRAARTAGTCLREPRRRAAGRRARSVIRSSRRAPHPSCGIESSFTGVGRRGGRPARARDATAAARRSTPRVAPTTGTRAWRWPSSWALTC